MKDILSAKEAAREADAVKNQIYNAIYAGKLEIRWIGRNVFIVRESFEKWRKRLETRRALRAEEQLCTHK